MKQVLMFAALAAVVVLVAAYFGATQALGAHPWWAFDVALYGVVPGLVLTVVLSKLPRAGVYWAMFDLAVSAGLVWWGKRGFVASSGDDSFAGSVWFFGWIAVCACAVAVLALTALRVRGRAD